MTVQGIKCLWDPLWLDIIQYFRYLISKDHIFFFFFFFMGKEFGGVKK